LLSLASTADVDCNGYMPLFRGLGISLAGLVVFRE
jgi:hypothetical protein